MQRRTIAWRDHEIVSKDIFEAILKQENVRNLKVCHNVTIEGNTTKHQIDVYWKFTAASVPYFTIVQVKKEKRKVSQGDMFTFKGVLDDIPGRPRGLFISQRGYQSGALKVAQGYGIIPYELTEVTEQPPVEMTTLSIATTKLRPEILSWEWRIYYTTLDDILVTLDAEWAQERNISLPVRMEATHIAQIEFAVAGQDPVKLREFTQNIVREHRKTSRVPMHFPVTEPTMMTGISFYTVDGVRLDSVSIVAFSGVISIREELRVWPFFQVDQDSGTRVFQLRNLLDQEYRHVHVSEDRVTLFAQLSAPKISHH